ncbi:3'-5' exonuclease domain - like 4 [Theobroma cacao]|nr:3'-5' exonuclease domain - like 4 [Theobroma cacao]
MECEETNGTDWDQNFTEEVIQAMDAVEATLHPSSSSSPCSLVKKCNSIGHQEKNPETRRQLPHSIVSPPPSFPFSLSRRQAYSKSRYPALRFGGQILYSRTRSEVEKAAMELLKTLKIKKKETGQVGVAIGGDAVKVFNDYNVSVKAVEDLSYVANQKLNRDCQSWGLASLTETLVCKELPKPRTIRLGNWELYPLSKEQLQYAATDAFASWHLYQVLKILPDAVKDPLDKRSEGVPTL